MPGTGQDTAVFGPVLTGGTAATVTLDSSRSLSSLGFSATGGAQLRLSARATAAALTLAEHGRGGGDAQQ